MKYEIIKGSEKDFEGCNADILTKYRITGHLTENFSTHSVSKLTSCSLGHVVEVIAERRPITEPELKPIYGDGIHDDTEVLQQRIDMGIDINSIIGDQGRLFNISKPLQTPITEPVVNQQLTTEWDGKGLPPVGVECEGLFPPFHGNSFEWQDCLVLYVFEHECAVKSKGTSTLHYCDQFRPIRSPEDVARDEAIASICFEIGVRPGNIVVQQTYDAIAAGRIKGITKTPTVSELMRVTESATREDCEAIVKLMGGEK